MSKALQALRKASMPKKSSKTISYPDVAVLSNRPSPGGAFVLMSAPDHTMTHTANKAISLPQNPFHAHVRNRWAERTYPLWTTFISAKDVTGKRVVRSWLHRRAKIALEKSLAKRGFAADGTCLPGSQARKEIHATAQFLVKPAMVKSNNVEVEEQMDWAVNKLLQWTDPRSKDYIQYFRKHPSRQRASF